ncbi:BrnT family toxin [Geomonas sp. Red32]|uniref:BrnT family toxin n=1 Tax=Geomonas sp. Red32 TaxID=2912856 RepID=UPI00202CB7B8|nr:BrnT family toxin [Geomonas sp. Red32]MCM0081553.1 BrnT family toxin [Geomonas sp. Red32]
MKYEWDPDKATRNIQKHGVTFADAVGVFEDDLAITIEDADHAEYRYVTIGMDFTLSLLVVVYTWRRENTIRIISARKANFRERIVYEKKL